MGNRNRTIVSAAAFLVGLIILWIVVEGRNAKAVSPFEAGTNLVTFLDKRRGIREVRKFVYNETIYFEVVGKVEGSALNFASGPPAYVFDTTGALIDWCGDLGDNPSFVKKWGGFSNSIPVHAGEVKKLVQIQ